jgi:hypothetical protein
MSRAFPSSADSAIDGMAAGIKPDDSRVGREEMTTGKRRTGSNTGTIDGRSLRDQTAANIGRFCVGSFREIFVDYPGPFDTFAHL